jgi:hypothetical protein
VSDFEAETTEEYERRVRRELRQGVRQAKHAARLRARYKERLEAALASQRERRGGGSAADHSALADAVERAVKREREKLAKAEARTFYVSYRNRRKNQYRPAKSFIEGAGTAIDVFGRGRTTEALRGYVHDGSVVVNNRALAKDWQAVGFDIADGMRKFTIMVEAGGENALDDDLDVFSQHDYSD